MGLEDLPRWSTTALQSTQCGRFTDGINENIVVVTASFVCCKPSETMLNDKLALLPERSSIIV